MQIDGVQDDWHYTGSIYSMSKVTQRLQKQPGEWNTMEIRLKGQQTTIKLNGVEVNDFNGNQAVRPREKWYEPVRGPRPDSGFIGLQNHDANSFIYFKEVSVTPN